MPGLADFLGRMNPNEAPGGAGGPQGEFMKGLLAGLAVQQIRDMEKKEKSDQTKTEKGGGEQSASLLMQGNLGPLERQLLLAQLQARMSAPQQPPLPVPPGAGAGGPPVPGQGAAPGPPGLPPGAGPGGPPPGGAPPGAIPGQPSASLALVRALLNGQAPLQGGPPGPPVGV